MEILTVAEAANRLRVSTKTVYNLLKSGQLRGRKIGRDWRTTDRAIQDFILGVEEPAIEPTPAAEEGDEA